MPLGMEVDLGPGDFVLDGDPPPPSRKRGRNPPIFGPCLLWPNGWIDQNANWYDGRPRPRPHCVTWRPSSPKRGTHPNFRPMSIVANGRPSQLLLSSCCICVWNISGTAARISAKFTRRRVWSLARMSLKVKVKGRIGQGHQGQENGILRPFRRPVYGLCL